MSISTRVEAFKSRFSQLLGPKRQGYEDLSTLQRPLVGGDDEDDEYHQDHGVARPGGAQYEPPAAGAEAGRGGSFTVSLPSQGEEIQEVCALGKDASEILWEMVAMGETGTAMEEMRSRAEMLQAQLRGLINDYSGEDEKLYASAFEAFDMLSRCLDENPSAAPSAAPAEIAPAAVSEPAVAAVPPPAAAPIAAAPPAPVTVAAPQAADLISFD